MKLYLDDSFLNRPFDNQSIGLNKLETEVLFLIIDLAKKSKINLVNSSVIELENSLNPFPERKLFVETVMSLIPIFQNLDEGIKKRALELEQKMNMKPIDALHLATAEAAKVDFFITCDYNVIKRYKGDLKVINSLSFLKYYESSN